MKCGEVVELADGVTLTCDLEAGQHPEGVHEDANGSKWFAEVVPQVLEDEDEQS